jgi:hypothetical protein
MPFMIYSKCRVLLNVPKSHKECQSVPALEFLCNWVKVERFRTDCEAFDEQTVYGLCATGSFHCHSVVIFAHFDIFSIFDMV